MTDGRRAVHALVLGGSIAGLLAARLLAEHIAPVIAGALRRSPAPRPRDTAAREAR